MSVAAGVTLTRWFGNEARRIYAMLDESADERETRELAEWIQRKGGSVTVNDLTHGVRKYRNDTVGARRALDALVARGIGVWDFTTGPRGGRPPERFRLVPTVTVTETPADTRESVGFGDGDAGGTAEDLSRRGAA